MRRFSSLLLMAAAAASTVPAAAAIDRGARAEARLAKALDGRVAGKPVSCINLRNIRSSEIIDRTAILYNMPGGLIYVNTPRMGQESLDDDDILVTRTFGSQLCSLDTVRLFDRGARFETGFVGLGEFVPYAKAKGMTASAQR
jgi:hypothetical protein